MTRFAHQFGYLIAFLITEAVVFPAGFFFAMYLLFRAGIVEYRSDRSLSFNEALAHTFGNTIGVPGFWLLLFVATSMVSIYLMRAHWWDMFGGLGKLKEIKGASYLRMSNDAEAPLVTNGYFLPEEEPRWQLPTYLNPFVQAGAAIIAFAITYVMVFVVGLFFGFLLFGGVPLADMYQEYAGYCLLISAVLFAWRNFRR